MGQLKGVGVALITPFHEDLSIDFESLTRLIDYNIDNGTNFLVVMGTTAEAATLSKEEKEKVIAHITKINNNRLPLVLGIGGNNTAEVVSQIKETDLSDFEAVLSVSPYYNKPNQEGLYQHYKPVPRPPPVELACLRHFPVLAPRYSRLVPYLPQATS